MKTLRTRIFVTWVCFAVIGALMLTGFSNPLLIAGCCLIISTVRGFLKPAFPRSARWFERLIYLLLLPVMAFFLVSAWLDFAEPWASAARAVLWIGLSLLLAFAAYEDARTWRLEQLRKAIS